LKKDRAPGYRLLFVLAVVFFFRVGVSAQVVVDKTCASCGRRQLDSLNLHPRSIRVNQVGYLPGDDHKRAFVANAAATEFQVVDVVTRTSVYKGSLSPIGASNEGGISITGYYNSINPLYQFDKPLANLTLSLADFSSLKAPGRYFLTCGKDTSATFAIDDQVYNLVFGTTLKFFGAQRCGATHSWFHQDCHLKDGSALGAGRAGDLSGGWHDCGDHGKYGETEGYAALVLALAYAYWPQKGEDLYGASYNDTLPFGNDGIPDVLNEAKVGADFILKLYKASKKDGLIDKADMYHSVGTGPGFDHLYWDVPEKQDAQPLTRGGPDRVVTAGIGSNVAGMFCAALAFFSWGWEPFDPAYAAECLAAAKDIYAKIISVKRGSSTKNPCCYPGGGPTRDDEALAAFALWFATKDTTYKFDLLDNPALGKSPNAQFNQGEFPTGLMAQAVAGSTGGVGPFMPGGWPTDYENTHVFTTYGLAKLVVETPQKAAAYGLSPEVADSLKTDCIALLARTINDGSNGTQTIPNAKYGTYGIHAQPPYNGVYVSEKWGYNRYNFGTVLELFLYWDLTGDKNYLHIGMDNMNYELGVNPWDLSFIMGAGDRNLQHPHNRASNPEGYNAGGFPYAYKVPKGAFMGGCHPNEILLDQWEKYDNTETCIDFSSQIVIPAQMLAADIPPDNEGPKFRNVNVIPEDVRATVTWTSSELSRDSLFLYDSPGGKLLQKVSPDTIGRSKQIILTGLTPSTTYYFYLKGMDIHRNVSEDKNGGAYYKFTTLSAARPAALITGVKVCNETDNKATVSWWTRNGPYDSRVDYDLATAAGKPAKVQQPDDGGLPTVFHAVTLKSLQAATGYKYSVTSGTTTDDSVGGYYHFKTTQVLVDYTIRVKPTNKGKSGASFQAYIDIANNEQKPYTGVELRFYFTADAATASKLIALGDDNQLWDVAGAGSYLVVSYGTNGDGKPVKLAGFTDVYYMPIVLKSTLPVAGRARIDLQFYSDQNRTAAPFDLFTSAWSVRAHQAATDPVPFAGIDLNLGKNGVYTTPEPVEKVNGQPVVSYTDDPYITAYYEGVHVFGYGPDYQTDVIQIDRTASLDLTAPVMSPLDKIDIRQEQTPALAVGGKAWVSPDGRIDEVWVNGAALPASSIARAADGSVTFSSPLTIIEGSQFIDVVAFDTAHCVFASRKIAVKWEKAPPPPPDTVKVVTANPASKTSRDPIAVSLSTPTAGAEIWYTLDGSTPKPGEAGTTKYQGAIVVDKDSVTLKAMATKTGLIPSGITIEKYAILPYRLVGVTSAALVDRIGQAPDGSSSPQYRDGYADALALVVDASEGPIDPAQATSQLTAAVLTGGFKLSAAGLAAALAARGGDTLFLPLDANTLPVANGVSRLTLALPGAPLTPADGMLAPGAVPVRDAIAPVLRSVVLHLHDAAAGNAPDTLAAVFSEPLVPAGRTSTAPMQGRLFGLLGVSALPVPATAADSLAARYGFTVDPGSPLTSNPVGAGEAGYAFLVRSSDRGAGPVQPRGGDWIWIDSSGGVADTGGNAQTSARNHWVPLRLAVPLNFKVGPTDTTAIVHVPTNLPPNDPIWSTIADGAGDIGSPGGVRIAVRSGANPVQFGGLTVDATAPFRVLVHVFSNLGVRLTELNLNLGDADFARLPRNANGSRRLNLLWNGRSDAGQLAGTGAYIYVWSVSGTDVQGHAVTSSKKVIYGLVRGI